VEDLASWGIGHAALTHATRSQAPHHDLLLVAELRSLFRRLRPDIVHTHNPKPGVLGRLAARAARVPVVVNTVHGLYALPEDPLTKRLVVYGLERLAATCSQGELVQNPEDIDTLTRIGVRRLHLLGNGIDLRRFDPASISPDRIRALRRSLGVAPHEVLFGAVGRLVWEKGYRELFEAYAQVRRGGAAARLVVIGPEDPGKADAVTPGDVARAERDHGVHFLGLGQDVEEQ
jgi:glycosyltransferase involved in cell wall biosynthesis